MGPAGQEAWLRSLGEVVAMNVDELALEFSDRSVLAAQWVEAGWLPATVTAPVSALDAALERISGEQNAELWTVQALHESSEWAAIRQLAEAVLAAVD